jgi:hypothetical protein
MRSFVLCFWQIIPVIKSRKMKWAGGAGLVVLRRFDDEEECEKGDHLEDFGLHFSILSQTLKKWDESAWTGLMWFRIGTSGGFT